MLITYGAYLSIEDINYVHTNFYVYAILFKFPSKMYVHGYYPSNGCRLSNNLKLSYFSRGNAFVQMPATFFYVRI
jgi:hypothetical protein